MTENIVTGKKYRVLADAANKVWNRISIWSKASDTEFNDGKTAETKLGAINGITSDVNCEDETVAASAAMVNQLNSKLTNSENESFYFDIQNGVRGYNTDAARGADTFFPFSSLKTVILAKADYNNNCRDMDNIQPDVYNPEYINIDESGVITFKKACDVFVTAFCRSDVNNGWAHPELKIGSIKLSYGTRDSYNYTFLERPLRYVVVNEGDVFSFSKTHQFQLKAENGYGYVVMLSGR